MAMDLLSIVSFTLIMAGLAALPSASVALVVARSATHGIGNGIASTVGIVVGDLVFVALALIGVSVIAEWLGAFFIGMRYLAATYLMWFGFTLWRAANSVREVRTAPESSSLLASAMAGFALTLGDVKAIAFYASLFPTLFDLTAFTGTDTTIVVAVTIITLGGVKLAYALAAKRIVDKLSNVTYGQTAKKATGGLLMGTGAYLVVKA